MLFIAPPTLSLSFHLSRLLAATLTRAPVTRDVLNISSVPISFNLTSTLLRFPGRRGVGLAHSRILMDCFALFRSFEYILVRWIAP